MAVVCLHRPPNNYFDTALVAAVASAYEELDAAGWCRAIVLAAEGKHFCAGLDFAANAGQDIAELYGQALTPLRRTVARGGRGPGRGHRGRLRIGPLGRLPGRRAVVALRRPTSPGWVFTTASRSA